MASAPITVEQAVLANSQFTGVAPNGPLTVVNGVARYAPGTLGGLFLFQDFAGFWLLEVQRVTGNFGNASSVTISVQTRDETPLNIGRIYSASSGGVIQQTGRGVILAADEQITVVTEGATQPMICRITVRPLLAAPPS